MKQLNEFTINFDGDDINVSAGQSVAEALLDNGIKIFGSNHKGYSRGPYCCMGLCGQCMIEIDSQINMRACTCKAVAGMNVRTQHDSELGGLEK